MMTENCSIQNNLNTPNVEPYSNTAPTVVAKQGESRGKNCPTSYGVLAPNSRSNIIIPNSHYESKSDSTQRLSNPPQQESESNTQMGLDCEPMRDAAAAAIIHLMYSSSPRHENSLPQAPAANHQTAKKQQRPGNYSLSPDMAMSYSRKDKSLGLLCERFLKLYSNAVNLEFSLDRVAYALFVERRRIYDIVNVLESVAIVERKCKNRYVWHGMSAVIPAIQQLVAGGWKPLRLLPEDRRGKSLYRLSQVFILTFLMNNPSQTVSLEQAANVLLGNDASAKDVNLRDQKTKIRRLYDIANVLVSLGIIKKVTRPSSRKPTFRWVCRLPASTNAMIANTHGVVIQPTKANSNEELPPLPTQPNRELSPTTSACTFNCGSVLDRVPIFHPQISPEKVGSSVSSASSEATKLTLSEN